MKTRYLLCALLAVVWLGVTVLSGVAQEAPKDRDIARLIELTGGTAIAQQMFGVVINQQTTLLKQRHPGIPDNEMRVVEEVAKEVFSERTPELTEAMAAIYDAHFSHAEVIDIIAFYESDTGKKALRLMPQILQESMAWGTRWGADIGEEVMRRSRERLKRKGFDL